MAINHVEDLNLPEVHFKKGDVIIEEGAQSSKIFILQTGKVKVVAEGEELCKVDVKGAVFGDMSVLLGRDTSAKVVATQDSVCLVIDDAANYLKTQPELIFGIAQILASRLVQMNSSFVHMKHDEHNSKGYKIKNKLHSWMLATNHFFDRDILHPFHETPENKNEEEEVN
jgi:CRP/FNR family transcriptional regulator, cyclic AMP receptor protein